MDDWRLKLATPLFWLIDFLLNQPRIARCCCCCCHTAAFSGITVVREGGRTGSAMAARPGRIPDGRHHSEDRIGPAPAAAPCQVRHYGRPGAAFGGARKLPNLPDRIKEHWGRRYLFDRFRTRENLRTVLLVRARMLCCLALSHTMSMQHHQQPSLSMPSLYKLLGLIDAECLILTEKIGRNRQTFGTCLSFGPPGRDTSKINSGALKDP